MKGLLVVVGAALALSSVGSSDVFAQHYGCNSGYGGSSYYGGDSSPRLSVSVGYGNVGVSPTQNYGYSNFNSGFGGYHHGAGYGGYQSYGGHVHRSWHDTTHLDYHAPSLVPHRGHFDYVPGHYDVHRTGHWDTHHH
jgi:hypothetical protein